MHDKVADDEVVGSQCFTAVLRQGQKDAEMAGGPDKPKGAGTGVILPPALVCVTSAVKIPSPGTLPVVVEKHPGRQIAGLLAPTRITGVAWAPSPPSCKALLPRRSVSVRKLDPLKGR